MNNKLSELSKPVMHEVRTLDGSVASVKVHSYTAPKGFTSAPLYSQEYVSSLLTALRNLYAACDTGERRGDGSQQGVAMPDWGTVDSVRALLENINNG